MNLCLCGMMGAGKTTVGVEIVKNTSLRLCDTDGLIVEKHGKIADIFARYGEGRFREIETETVKTLAKEDGLVISTGGGLVLRAENVALLGQNGKIVYLRASLETLVERLHADGTRPLLQTEEGLCDRLARLLKERAPIYEQVADFVVDVDGKTPEEIAKEIIKIAGI